MSSNSKPYMRIPASRLAALLQPNTVYSLLTAEYKGADPALPYTHAVAMAFRGEVEAVATNAGRIRYLRILRPEEREPVFEALPKVISMSGGDVRPALVTFYEEPIGNVRVGTLAKVRGDEMRRWADDEGFNPLRWNPDRIPEPLQGVGLRASAAR